MYHNKCSKLIKHEKRISKLITVSNIIKVNQRKFSS